MFHFRLAYHQRMVDIVPDNFGAFVPDKPEPACKYEGEPSPGNNFVPSKVQYDVFVSLGFSFSNRESI